jgi:hypothetical protein
MKETAALVRRHAPRAKIVLGGCGTEGDGRMLLPHGDHVCREKAVRTRLTLRLGPFLHPALVRHEFRTGVSPAPGPEPAASRAPVPAE